MDKEKTIKFTDEMIEEYGVRSYKDNLADDWTIEDEGLWFECPKCGEPILFGDWELDEVSEHCPICEFEWE